MLHTHINLSSLSSSTTRLQLSPLFLPSSPCPLLSFPLLPFPLLPFPPLLTHPPPQLPLTVKEAFNLLLADKQVESVLVNIFGGIVNCATIANGITAAAKSIDLKVPLIVRLEGTNVEEAKRIMTESGLPIISAEDLDDAAQKAVASLKR